MADLAHKVQEALEAEGYEVERVSPPPPRTESNEGQTWGVLVSPIVQTLVVYLSTMVGVELTRELIHLALMKSKDTVLRQRAEGDSQAEQVEAVGIWIPDGPGGWQLAESARIDE